MSAMAELVRGSRAGRSTKSGGRSRARGDEAIAMKARRHGYFPKVFMWRGTNYHVDAVNRCWTVSRRGGKLERYCFEVTCGDRVFHVYQDIRYNTWHVKL